MWHILVFTQCVWALIFLIRSVGLYSDLFADVKINGHISEGLEVCRS